MSIRKLGYQAGHRGGALVDCMADVPNNRTLRRHIVENSILAMLVDEMAGETPGARAVAVTGLAPMSFAIELRKGAQETSSYLVVCLDPIFPALFTLDAAVFGILTSTPAETLPQGFIDLMSDSLRQTSLDEVEQYDSDRAVKIRFSAVGGRPRFVVWLELFGRRPSAILVNENTGLIEACSREGITCSAGLILRPGESYVPPSQGGKIDAHSLSRRDLESLMEKSGIGERREDLPLALSRFLKGMSPHAAEQILENLSSVGRLTADDLLANLKAALADPRAHFCPAVVPAPSDSSHPPGLTPIYRSRRAEVARPGTQAEIFGIQGSKEKSHEDTSSSEIHRVPKCFATASEATRFSFLELCRWHRRAAAERLRRQAAALSDRLTRLKAFLSQDFSVSMRAHEFRATAELILANLKDIKRGSEFVELKDIHADGRSLVKVELDPALSPSDNAERYFKKARKARKASALLRKRMASVERSLQMVEEFRESLPEEVDAKELERNSRTLNELSVRLRAPLPTDSRLGMHRTPPKSWSKETEGSLERAREQEKFRNRVAQESGRETRGRVSVAAGARTSGTKIGGRKAKGREAFNPRLFETSDGFGVIVGRNNKENDYVTHHLSKPEDLWFHASGIPGSHVILRKKGKSPPSRKAIEEAAAIAAYFSKGKTSSAVPVIYAEKKYVHRPRGARPGTATCTREKFLMVRPRKPKPALAS